jgi:antitoxin component of MazEF toxin-antitoxin module
MPNTSYKNKDIRKLTRVGKASFAVTLPVEYVAKLKWKEKQKLKVVLKGRTILIRDWKK